MYKRQAVQHDGEAGQTLGDFLQNVEAQRGRNEDAVGVAGALLGLELVGAVRRTDRDGDVYKRQEKSSRPMT